MIQLYCTVSSLLLLTRDRVLRQAHPVRDRSDEGASVLELVVISLGLFLLALAVVAGITTAVNDRLARIR